MPGIYPSLSVAENLEVPLVAGVPGAACSVCSAVPPGAAMVGNCSRAFASRSTRQPAGVLAHGQKQWLEIAMLLAGEARLLLLDEPTAGMTVAETARTADLIREIHAATGVAVLIIEHDMSFVERLDCPVVVSDARRRGVRGQLSRNPARPGVRAAYLGQAGAC